MSPLQPTRQQFRAWAQRLDERSEGFEASLDRERKRVNAAQDHELQKGEKAG